MTARVEVDVRECVGVVWVWCGVGVGVVCGCGVYIYVTLLHAGWC